MARKHRNSSKDRERVGFSYKYTQIIRMRNDNVRSELDNVHFMYFVWEICIIFFFSFSPSRAFFLKT